MDFLLNIDLHTVYLFVFSLGISIGLGATFLTNVLFLFSLNDGKLSKDEFVILRKSRIVIWVGILIYSFAGIGLFSLAHEIMLRSEIFYAAMTIATLLILNELYISFFYLPNLRNNKTKTSLENRLLVLGMISCVSWTFLLLHHTIYFSDLSYFFFLALYFLVITLGIFAAIVVRKSYMKRKEVKLLMKFGAMATLLAVAMCSLHLIFTEGNSLSDEKINVYTVDDVALHNNTEDCWLAVDAMVFNVTEAARLHPALFNCGTDATVNYHKNHGDGVRDKMMQYYIGDLGNGTGITNIDIPFEKKEALAPYLELYVEEGSWDTKELMLVVEKDAEKLLVINGNTHEEVARIHDVGFQPHTSVYSSDAKFMYIVSRDGWLTKIDLETLEPVISVDVGENSRGTAITENDKYIAIGNYEPGNLVILDAVSMEILTSIPLIGEVDGKEIESRAGAVVDDGNKIVVALKDLTSVWSIDTDQKNFPVTHKFDGIGEGIPTLHDGFLTQDGNYYIVASQGSNTAWVLDLNTMSVITEVETGETPHTGPGASWGDYIYVPALGEGLITVINTKTWEVEKKIETGGPGLFVRSYNEDPSYPYVWADTAFGDSHDEIYVIDARINEIVKTIIPVEGESSWHPEFTYDGSHVYIVSQSANEVEVYDAYTFELVKRIESSTPSAISNVGIRAVELGL